MTKPLTIKTMPGDTIQTLAKDACHIARALNRDVEFNFFGHSVTIHPQALEVNVIEDLRLIAMPPDTLIHL